MPSTIPTDIRAGRLSEAELSKVFATAHPPLTRTQALVEAQRCYDCYDAPCTSACPTHIDIPSFMQRIAQNNARGAAEVILQANPLGGMCARVCPTEVLCEEVCVRNTPESRPVEIGLLQRFATDEFFAHPHPPIFQRSAATGKRVAIIGAGPAGLSCAHGLARLGHDITIFEARAKSGGLNEYGLAAYKTTDDFAQREIAWLLSIGGITIRPDQQLGRDFTLDALLRAFDALFLAVGLSGVNSLGIAEPSVRGLRNAVDFIAELRQAPRLDQIPVGRRVVVIGGGMTAVDAAVQSKMLGAEEVTIVYRRGAAHMSASAAEQAWAQTHGVTIRHWSAPVEVLTNEGHVTGIRFQTTTLEDHRLQFTDEHYVLPADVVYKAIGQSFPDDSLPNSIRLVDGRIAVDDEQRTSVAKIWAGGDCCAGGLDLTVQAVEHGKRACASIHRTLDQM